LRVVIWDGERRGLPTVPALQEEIPDLPERVVAMSGPDAMIAHLTSALRAAGVPQRDRHRSAVATIGRAVT
jgi:ferredoxin-NADP reductase